MPNHKTWPLFSSETVLEDDYPVFYDYIYIIDGRLRRSDVQGAVWQLKKDLNAKEVRRCELLSRTEARLGDFVEIPQEKEGIEKDSVESVDRTENSR